jgi:hypothetical protein
MLWDKTHEIVTYYENMHICYNSNKVYYNIRVWKFMPINKTLSPTKL